MERGNDSKMNTKRESRHKSEKKSKSLEKDKLSLRGWLVQQKGWGCSSSSAIAHYLCRDRAAQH